MNKIQEVKQRADIVKVAEYFEIKKRQCRIFHKEKTPSFYISQSKQIFKCFGCRNWWRLHNISIKIVKY